MNHTTAETVLMALPSVDPIAGQLKAIIASLFVVVLSAALLYLGLIKKEWGAAIGILLGAAALAIFIVTPYGQQVLIDLSTQFWGVNTG